MVDDIITYLIKYKTKKNDETHIYLGTISLYVQKNSLLNSNGHISRTVENLKLKLCPCFWTDLIYLTLKFWAILHMCTAKNKGIYLEACAWYEHHNMNYSTMHPVLITLSVWTCNIQVAILNALEHDATALHLIWRSKECL